MDDLIADIERKRRLKNAGRSRLLEFEHEAAKQAAEKAFAGLNGWRPTRRGSDRFDIRSEDGTPAWWAALRLFDHQCFFVWAREPRRTAAVLTQPYGPDPAKLPRVFGKLGGKDKVELVWHAPPVIDASFHYPGATRFYILTRPETPAVKWLPEQCGHADRSVCRSNAITPSASVAYQTICLSLQKGGPL
jgi:hypothetical protein